jgi:DNA-binding MarR family transcriptional regulator
MSQELADRIMGSALSISRKLRQHLSCKHESDANILQIHALLHIKDHEGMTMKELAAHLKITSPSATSFVNRLVKLRWVERFTDKDNRKLVRLRVSSKGKEMLKETMECRRQDMHSVLSLLPAKDQQELARILSSLAQSLEHTSL